jgi:intracellular multiplication protein IcmK
MNRICLTAATILLINTAIAAEKKADVLPSGLIEHTTDAKPVDEVSDEKLTDLAFEYLMKNSKGLTPAQRRAILELEQQKQDALLDIPPPKAQLEILPVSMDPSEPPVKIYLTPGWDTHLSVIDANGNPWPIQYYSSGNQSFPISELGGGANESESEEDESLIEGIKDDLKPASTSTTNVNTLSKLKITSANRAGSTNMTLLLQGMKEIVNVQLVANTKKYYPSPVLQVPMIGPNGSTSMQHMRGISLMSNDDAMRDIAMGGHNLDSSFKQIKTDHPRVKAWMKAGKVFIRSPYFASVPSPIEGQAGTGGYRAYLIPYLPAITLSGNGNQQITVKLYKNQLVDNNVERFSN